MADFTQVGVEAVVKNFAKFNKDLNAMNKAIATSGKESAAAASATNKFNATMSSFATGGLSLVLRGLADFGKAVVEEGSAFQKEMSNVGAISGAVGKDFDALSQQAVKLGSTTKFTATEAAEGMSFLAMAGFETNEIIGAMPGTLNLAAAANLDLGTSADIVSNIISGFGATAESTNQYVDVLTRTFTTSNTSLQQLGAGMKFVAPVAKSLGYTVEDTAAAMGILGNAGIQGSLAGTTLRGVMLSLASPTKAAQSVMDELGIAVFDAQGNMLPMPQIIGNINRATAGMTQEQRNATLQTLVGAKRLAGFNILLAEGEQGLARYTSELSSGTTAADIASKQLDNLSGDVTLLQSSFSGFKIGLFQLLEPTLRDAAQGAIILTTKLQEGAASWVWVVDAAREINNLNGGLEGTALTLKSLNDATKGWAGLLNPLAGALGNVSDVYLQFTGEIEVQNDAVEAESDSWTRQMGIVDNVADSQSTLASNVIDAADAEDVLTDAIDETSNAAYSQYEVLAQSTENFKDQSLQRIAAMGEERKAAQENAKAQMEMLSTLATDTASFYTSLRSARDENIASEQVYNANLASIRSGANEELKAQETALSDELVSLEQQRQEKIQWVLTGAHARTQEENDRDLAYWNQHFDQLVADTQTKYGEQTAAIQSEMTRQEAAAQAARDKEVAEQQAHLEELKLNAALATLETTGQLQQFTGGLAVSAQEAAELIRAGVLPVTNELGVAIQGALGQLQSQEAATATQAQANQGVLQEALAGTLQSTQNLEAGITNLASPFAKLGTETAPITGEAMGLMFDNLTLQTDTFTQGPATMMDQKFMDFNTITLPTTQTTYDTSFVSMTDSTNTLITTVQTLVSNITSIGTETETAANKVVKAAEKMAKGFKEAGQAIEKYLWPAIKEAIKLLERLEHQANTAKGAISQISGTDRAAADTGHYGMGLSYGIGLQNGLGLGFTVPPGYPNDSYGPIFVESGEQMLVTPRGTTIDEVVMDRLMSAGMVNASMTVNNFEMNVSTVASAQAVIQQYEVAKAMIAQ